MKHYTWFVCFTVATGLANIDFWRPLMALKTPQESVPENQNVNNNVLPMLTVSERPGNDKKPGFVISKFQLTRSNSVMQASSSPRRDDTQLANSIPPESDRRVLQRSKSSQIGEPNDFSKRDVLLGSINEFALKPRITRLQKRSLHSKLQDAAPYQGSRLRSANQPSTTDRTIEDAHDRYRDSTFIPDIKLTKPWILKVLSKRPLKLESDESMKQIERSTLQGRSVLLPRGKPDRTKKGKNPSSSKPNSSKSITNNDPGPSRNSRSSIPNPIMNPDKDRLIITKQDSLSAKAGVQIQGFGVGHTANPIQGSNYFPSAVNLPIYRNSEHRDQAAAGGKIYSHPSGKLGSIAAHAEGRNVRIHIEPGSQSTASYEVRPRERASWDKFVVPQGSSVSRHINAFGTSDGVHVIASLVGPGYVSAAANTRGIDMSAIPPDPPDR